jgi:predicted dehydrogenase
MLFSYFNRDPADIRNLARSGGGGLLDIGCYAIALSRFAFGEEHCARSDTISPLSMVSSARNEGPD